MPSSPVYIGVDIAKETLEISAPYPSKLRSQYPNTSAGHARLIKALPLGSQLVMEATGGYQTALMTALHEAKIPLSVVNPRHVRAFAHSLGQSAKTDSIDAQMIARFAAFRHVQPAPTPSPAQTRMTELVARRQQLIVMQTAEKNHLEHGAFAPVIKSIKNILKRIEKEIALLDKLIACEIENDPALSAKAKRLCLVEGVGPVVAASLLAQMPELGSVSRKAAAALLGVAPFAHDSGKERGRRHVSHGRAAPRCALYMAAVVAIRHNPILRAFYAKLKARNKPSKVALVAVMRKLIVLLNHLLKNPNFSLAS